MPKLKYFHQVLSRRIKVFVSPSELKSVEQVKDSIKKSSAAVLVGKGDDMEMVLHIAGFNLPSWSESLNLTGRLHEYLDLALSKKAKFILVLPDRDDEFIKVSLSLVEQFSRLFKLNYEIILVDQALKGDELAKALLEKIFHGHVSQAVEIPTQILETVVRPSKQVKTDNSLWKKISLTIFGFFITTWLIFGVSYLTTLDLLSCWKDICQNSALVTAQITRAAGYVTLGADGLANHSFIPIDALVNISIRSRNIYGLSSDLLLKLTSSSGLLGLSEHKEDLDAALDNINFQLVSLQAVETKFNWLSQWKGSQIQRYAGLRQLVVKITNLAPDLPQLIGVNQPKKYAIIFQDNTELRATGGFIQGFALMEVVNGQVGDIQYFNATQTDQLLRGQVSAPVDMQKALGETNWYLRDGNWDPNFVASASRIAWFIDKELGGSPDVVVVVNWQTLSSGLNILGSVNLPDFGGKITSENWLEKYLQYAKADASDTNMMMEVAKNLIAHLSTSSANQKKQFVSLLLQQLGLRQIMLAPITFESPGLALVDWQGNLAVPDCRSQHPCQILQIMAIDSNVGLNRVNPFITRSHKLVANVGTDKTDYEYTIDYQNNSPKPGWPTGDYKNFLRIYLPKGVVVGDVSLNGRSLVPLEYQVAFENNLLVLRLPFSVLNQKGMEVKIRFAQVTPGADKFHSQLDFVNQPGESSEKLEVTYNYPKVWLSASQKQFTVAGAGFLKYNTEVDSPYKIDIDFVKWKNTP